jgi:hypothetical protein
MDDRFTEAGAGVLARKIERFWRAKGHKNVRAWIEPISGDFDKPIFAVRSNLINGLPPEVALAQAA